MTIVLKNMLYWSKQHYNIIVAERQMLEVNVRKFITLEFSSFQSISEDFRFIHVSVLHVMRISCFCRA